MGCKFRAAECVGLNAEENVERFEQNIVKVCLHYKIYKFLPKRQPVRFEERFIQDFDYILCMDQWNFEEIMKVKNKYRDSQAKVYQLGKFSSIEINEGDNICDCYGGTKRDYSAVFIINV